MNKLILLLILVVQIETLYAQDIKLSVKKGIAKINGKEWLKNYPPKSILKTDKISASENAILIFRKGSSFARINCPCTNLSYKIISKKLTLNSVNISPSTIDVIFNKPLEAEASKQKGGVSRGDVTEIDTFSINLIDSAWIMSDEYFVHWESDFPSKQLGNMKLYKKDDVSSPIVESEKNIINLQGLSPGWYQLDFEVELSITLKTYNVNGSLVFLLPTNEEKMQVLNEITAIIKELNQFENEELTSIIIDEFKNTRRLYGLNK